MPHPCGVAQLETQVSLPHVVNFLFVFVFVFVHLFLGAPPSAYGGSQARGPIGAAAAAYARAIATPDLSHVCDLHHSTHQRQIPDPLNEARDQTHILMDTSRICFC